MKSIQMIAATALVAFTFTPVFAASPVAPAPAPMAMHDHGSQMHAMMARAEKAKTPAECKKLMAENMGMMKSHMAGMSAMDHDKPMVHDKPMDHDKPMVMDAAHMEKMHKHMMMMHQMMESLMVQQQLLMKSGK